MRIFSSVLTKQTIWKSRISWANEKPTKRFGKERAKQFGPNHNFCTILRKSPDVIKKIKQNALT